MAGPRQGPQHLFLVPPLTLIPQHLLQWAGCSDPTDWQVHTHSAIMHLSKMPVIVRRAIILCTSKKEKMLPTKL